MGIWPPASRSAFGGEQRADQDEGRNFLRGRLDGVTLHEVGLPHLAFQLAKIQLVLPALGIELREFDRGAVRASTKLVHNRNWWERWFRSPDAHTNLADFEPFEYPRRAVPRAQRNREPGACDRAGV